METKLQQDIYMNNNNKQVLQTAQIFGIRHVLEQNETIIPVANDKAAYIFMAFKKTKDGGYGYIKVENPKKNKAIYIDMLLNIASVMKADTASFFTKIANTN